ncbi:M-phase phosphoprotein 8 [Liparis tanakae]|uniref:M-phase phosphoprotein 8 n=1 Tax=Liparis tanakae TaxID=230148 RepID=A0A4Z2H4X6_9TELE|nr:M-phase phosphoprotein 8 [Liparis tanakae]
MVACEPTGLEGTYSLLSVPPVSLSGTLLTGSRLRRSSVASSRNERTRSRELRDAVKSGDYMAVKLALNSKEDYNLDQELSRV